MFLDLAANLGCKTDVAERGRNFSVDCRFKSSRKSRWKFSCLLWKVVFIDENERGLVYKNGRLVKVLVPGEYRFSVFNAPEKLEVFDISLNSNVLDNINMLTELLNGKLPRSIEKIDLSDNEVGFFYSCGKLDKVLDPGSTLLIWKGVENVNVETIDFDEDLYSYAGI